MAFVASDAYGAGTRAAFYMQWYGIVFTHTTRRTRRRWWTDIRGAHWLFRILNVACASSLAVGAVIQGANAATGFTAVDAYLMLFLASGVVFFLVPIYALRAATRCRTRWDPSLAVWPSIPALLDLAYTLFLVLVIICQIWFWLAGLNELPSGYAEQAFEFSPIDLHDTILTVSNVILHFALLMACIGTFCFRYFAGKRYESKRKKWYFRRKRQNHVLLWVEPATSFIVATVVLAAIELVITWNTVPNLDDGATAANLVPLLATAAVWLFTLWLWSDRPMSSCFHPNVLPRGRSPPRRPSSQIRCHDYDSDSSSSDNDGGDAAMEDQEMKIDVGTVSMTGAAWAEIGIAPYLAAVTGLILATTLDAMLSVMLEVMLEVPLGVLLGVVLTTSLDIIPTVMLAMMLTVIVIVIETVMVIIVLVMELAATLAVMQVVALAAHSAAPVEAFHSPGDLAVSSFETIISMTLMVLLVPGVEAEIEIEMSSL